MSIMLRNQRLTALTLVMVCAGGCATSDFRTSRADRTMWRPVTDSAIANAPEEQPPEILPETHFAAAQLFEHRGLPGKAITQYRKAIAANHRYVAAYHQLGLLFSAMGRREEALEALAQAVALRPDSAILRNNLGFELLLSRRWDEAESQLRRAIELKPDFARAHVNLHALSYSCSQAA